MIQEKITRLNQLARKSKTEEGLTPEEREEQRVLRNEYLTEWKLGVMQTLDNTYVVDEKGNKRKLQKKSDKH
ncbi:MAG: DUF896 domain-containing protein [Corallococcus sp.]|nr:DUF896 domain-containing protein [Corallococcus sp.]